jgi:hypothetical protein
MRFLEGSSSEVLTTVIGICPRASSTPSIPEVSDRPSDAFGSGLEGGSNSNRIGTLSGDHESSYLAGLDHTLDELDARSSGSSSQEVVSGATHTRAIIRLAPYM